MVGPPQEIFNISLAQIALDLNMPPQLGDFQAALSRVVRSAHLDILFVHHPDLDPGQVNVLFAGHAHQRDDGSIRQTHL